MENKFEKIYKELKKVYQNIPNKIAVVAQQHFEESFEKRGYNETPFEKWKQRKNPNNKKNKGRAILVQSGRLSKSIRIISVSSTNIKIGTDVPYAKIHNEGGQIEQGAKSDNFIRTRNKKGKYKGTRQRQKGEVGKSYKARTIVIPKRQFLGENNKDLQKKIDDIFEKAIKKIFENI